MQVCRLTTKAYAELYGRIGRHAAPFSGLLNLVHGEVTAPDGSRRKVEPGDIEIAACVETGERTLRATFKRAEIETFRPYWA